MDGGGNEGLERVDERQGFVHDLQGRVHTRRRLVHQRQGRVDAAGLSEETSNFNIPPLSVYIPPSNIVAKINTFSGIRKTVLKPLK